MNQTQHEPPMPARPRRDCRFKFGPAHVALLLILAPAGLGLLVWRAAPDTPRSGTQEGGAQAGRDFLPKDQVASAFGTLQEILARRDVIPSHHHPLLGWQAPDFELADPDGKVWNLGELSNGGPVVLIFYYGYHCISCVRHLAEVNRDMPLFREVGARVVAISADPPELTQRQFQQNGPFGFTVLSDPENKVARAYRVFKRAEDADLFRHGSFVIDRDGTIQWVNIGDAPFRRNSALLYEVANCTGLLPNCE
jgi:peroxiredoxin